MSAVLRMTLGRDGEISVPFGIVEKREARTRQILDQLERDDGFSILDASHILCDGDICAGTRSGRSLYFDDNHLSVYGSNLIARSGLYDPVFLTAARPPARAGR